MTKPIKPKTYKDDIDDLRRSIFDLSMTYNWNRPVTEHQIQRLKEEMAASNAFWSIVTIGVCFVLMLLVRA